MDYVRLYFLGISSLIYVGGGFCIYYCRKLLQSLDDAFGTNITSNVSNNPRRQKMVNSLAVLRSRVRHQSRVSVPIDHTNLINMHVAEELHILRLRCYLSRVSAYNNCALAVPSAQSELLHSDTLFPSLYC